MLLLLLLLLLLLVDYLSIHGEMFYVAIRLRRVSSRHSESILRHFSGMLGATGEPRCVLLWLEHGPRNHNKGQKRISPRTSDRRCTTHKGVDTGLYYPWHCPCGVIDLASSYQKQSHSCTRF